MLKAKDFADEATRWWYDLLRSPGIDAQQAQAFGDALNMQLSSLDVNAICIKPHSPIIAESAASAEIVDIEAVLETLVPNEFDAMYVSEQGVRIEISQ